MAKNLCIAMAIAGGAFAGIPAAQSDGLIYSVLHRERSNQCVPMPGLPALRQVRMNELQYVAPAPGAAYTSKAYAPLPAYCEHVGDYDGDGNYWDPTLFGSANIPGGIDAVLLPREGIAVLTVNMRTVFISPAGRVLLPYPSGPFDPGDVGRLLPPNGPWPILERFLSAPQVIAAFNLITAPVNVDAIALDPDPQRGGIYLSFEDQETNAAGMVIGDGDLLRIPYGAIGWFGSMYDGAMLVAGVAPGSGQVLAVESPTVDSWVQNANVGNATGVPATTVNDLDGLTPDPQGGYFGPMMIRHLWMTCEDPAGGGAVVSTLFGGSIAVLAGVPLGSTAPAPTTGLQVGLVTLPMVGSLNGLAYTHEPLCHLVTDALPNPPGMSTNIEFGGMTGLMWMLLFGAWADAGIPDVPVALFNPCYPDLYLSPAYAFAILPAGGPPCSSLPFFLPSVPGFHVTVQAIELAPGGPRISTPTVLDL